VAYYSLSKQQALLSDQLGLLLKARKSSANAVSDLHFSRRCALQFDPQDRAFEPHLALRNVVTNTRANACSDDSAGRNRICCGNADANANSSLDEFGDGSGGASACGRAASPSDIYDASRALSALTAPLPLDCSAATVQRQALPELTL
jgi:hypothetical protein